MDRKTLDSCNPCYDDTRWGELEALAKGGKLFHRKISTFLPQNPMEPEMRYQARIRSARYYSYTGSIINLYASWLFIAGFESKAYERDTAELIASPDAWYGKFEENVGGETTLKTFMKDRFRDAMTQSKSVWLAELPQADDEMVADTRAEYDRQGLGNAQLYNIDPKNLIDWCTDDDGTLIWAIVKTTSSNRENWAKGRDTITDTWKIYERETVTVYEKTRKKDEGTNPDEIIPCIARDIHGFKRVPLVIMSMPHELCVGEQTYDAQILHFQLDNALTWAIKLCCYPMPIWKLADSSEGKLPVIGVGYAQFIGEKEDLTWSSPPSESFDVIAKNRDSKRDEIFRIVHQMAQGMDNNAETVGRSADSKEIDAAATRIMLHAYGEIVGKAIEETYELISEARGDDNYEWSVEGFSGYDTATVNSLLGAIGQAKKIGLPSVTFQREVAKKGALAMVPELDPRVKQKIREEIDAFEFEIEGKVLEEIVADTKAGSAETVAGMKAESAASLQTESLTAQAASQDKALKSAEKVAKSKPKPAPPGKKKA